MPLPRPGRWQTRAALALILGSLAATVVTVVSHPAAAQSSTDPVLVGAAGPVDEAWAHIDTKPLTIKDLTAAEGLIRKADGILGPAIGTAAPARWAKERGIDTMLLVELFNRFNETSDRLQEARRYTNSVVWAMDADTRRHLAEKAKRLEAARKTLPKDRFRLFLAIGEDGDPPATVKRPWTTRSSPRYGFDVGRFRREETVDIGTNGQVTVERHLDPAPWFPGGINAPIRPFVRPMPAPTPVPSGTTVGLLPLKGAGGGGVINTVSLRTVAFNRNRPVADPTLARPFQGQGWKAVP